MLGSVRLFAASSLCFVLMLFQLGCSVSEESVSEVVDDGVTEPGDDPAESTQNFAETVEPEDSVFAPARVLNVQVSISDENWNQLRFEHRKPVEFFGEGCREPIPDAFNYYPADVTVDGTSLGEVGVRTKGLIGSINPARPSLKVKLQEYQDELLYQDQKRFTFNNQTSDPARLSTCMAFYIFRQMGVPASRCNFANIKVNDDDMGVYANVEAIKKPMLRRLFGDDSGNLYEGTVADIRTGFTARVEKKTNADEHDWSDLNALLAAIESPDDEFVERIDAVLDIDAFLRFTAASVMVGHWDSFSGNANNYYFYQDPGTNKFYFLPWGPDDTFGNRNLAENGRVRAAMGGSLLARRLFEDPVIMTRYRDMMRTMLNEVWDDDTILAELARMEALIGQYVVGQDAETHADNVNDVRVFLQNRKRDLLNAVNADPIPFTGELPESPVCLQYSGDLNASFVGRWDTLGAENPFVSSSGTLTAGYGPFDFVSQAVGITAGEVGSPGATELGLVAFLVDSQILFIRLMLPTDAIQPNSTFAMGDPRVSSLMVLVGEGGNPQIIGFLGDGEISFGEDLELTSGGTFAAEMNVAIWGAFPATD